MGIGFRIKEARERKNWTQTELGEKIGVTGSAITNYENNTSHPKEPILYKLLDVLEVDANFLFQDEMHSVKPDMLSFFERDIINKYRKLDKYGREIIDSVMSIELKRINDEERQAVIPTKSAAFGGQANNTPITEDEMERAAALAREIRNQQNME